MNRNMIKIATVIVATATIVVTFQIYGTKLIIEEIREYSLQPLLSACFFLIINYVAAFIRFFFVIKRLGNGSLGWRPAFAAFNIGQISSVFLFNVVGQSLGRAAILAKHGVGVDCSVVGTYIERLVAAAVLGVCALVATVVLFGTLGLQFQGGIDYLAAVGGALTVAGFFGWLLVLRGRREWRICLEIAPKWSLLWPTAFFTIIAQTAMGAAFWTLLSPHIAHVDAGQVFAVLVIVMFAASLPISFSGWGIRELSAAKALGLIGVLPSAAVAVALIIGTLSLVIPLLAAGASAALASRQPTGLSPIAADPAKQATVPGATSLVLLLGFLTALLILFQIRVPLEHHVATINLADVCALTGLGLIGYMLWQSRHQHVLARPILGCLAIISFVIGYSLLVGYIRYGTVDWAWINRGLGWLVCLGFSSIGAGLVIVGGERAKRRVLAMFLVALLAVCILELAFYVLTNTSDIELRWFDQVTLEGFALDRNAFSFQILTGMVVLWAFTIRDVRRQTSRLRWIPAAILLLAAYWTFSRALLVAAFVMLVFGILWTPMFSRFRLRAIAVGAVAAACIPVALAVLGEITRKTIGTSFGNISTTYPLTATSDTSDAERLQTIFDGLALWYDYPLFGAGLGGYVQERLLQNELFQVIHNVPVWLLAETGILGLILVLVGVGWVVRWLWSQRNGRNGIDARAAALLLSAFAVFALVHDVFAQRVFWFVFGLFVAAIPQRADRTT